MNISLCHNRVTVARSTDVRPGTNSRFARVMQCCGAIN
jgi:hypothetical protein